MFISMLKMFFKRNSVNASCLIIDLEGYMDDKDLTQMAHYLIEIKKERDKDKAWKQGLLRDIHQCL